MTFCPCGADTGLLVAYCASISNEKYFYPTCDLMENADKALETIWKIVLESHGDSDWWDLVQEYQEYVNQSEAE